MVIYSTGPEFLEIYPVIAERVRNITFLETNSFKMLKSTKKHKNFKNSWIKKKKNP